MGTKIKPAFKSEFPRVSEGWHLFRIVEPRIDIIKPEDRKEKDGVTNDRNFVVRSAVEGGEEDGVEVTEFFANYSKKEFGLSRLAGLMIKTEAIQPIDEIDADSMRTEKFETKFKMALPKRLFGGKVKHVGSTQKKEGTDEANVFANIVEYATVKEYNEIIARPVEKGVSGKKQGSSDKGPGEKSAETASGESTGIQKDPWA